MNTLPVCDQCHDARIANKLVQDVGHQYYHTTIVSESFNYVTYRCQYLELPYLDNLDELVCVN